jgi:hypothetical protein
MRAETHCRSRQPFGLSGFRRSGACEAILWKALIKSSSVPSASTSRAVSMNCFDCSGSSGGRAGLRGICLSQSSMKGSRNCRGSLRKLRGRRLRSRGCLHRPLALSPCATSRFVGQPATLRALKSKRRTLHVIALYHLLSVAQRGSIAIAHARADTVHQEPSDFHAAIEYPLDLPSADAFLALANQMDCL